MTRLTQLLEHRLHAVGECGGGEACRLGELLERERVVPVGVGGSSQQWFRHRNRVRRQSGYARTPFVGGGQQSVMFDDLLHDAQPKGCVGIDVAAT